MWYSALRRTCDSSNPAALHFHLPEGVNHRINCCDLRLCIRPRASLTRHEIRAYTRGITAFPPASNRQRPDRRAASLEKESLMKRLLAIAFCTLLVCGATAPLSSAQMSQITNALSGKNKKQATDPNDISNVDKDKIAHIEQTPEIQDAIQQEWDTLRRNDMQLAYGI